MKSMPPEGSALSTELRVLPRTYSFVSAIFSAIIILCVSAGLSHAAGGSQRNILLVIADDLGTADATPDINAIAAGGVRLTRFYANPYCSPTRAALMTGSYAERVGINAPLLTSSTTGLPSSERTIAEITGDAGYATALIGKWHLGHLDQFRPENRFDYFFGSLTGQIDHTTHVPNTGGQPDWWRQGDRLIEPEYDTTAVTREAKAFMARTSEPWFMVVSYQAVHTPNQPDYPTQLRLLDEGASDVMRSAPPNTIIWFTSDNGGYSGHNGALRGSKGTLYEGGIRVPAWVRWDGHLAPGSLARVGHAIDVLPTLCGLLGIAPGRPVDGVSLATELLGGPWGPTRRLFWSTGGKFAHLINPWKLVQISGRNELYNLASDPKEAHNIAASNAGTVATMRAALGAWRQEVGR